MDLPKDFYKKVESPEYLKSVIYGDTDSIFLVIPTPDKDLAAENKISLSNKIGKDINKDITDYLNNIYFKRANIDPKYNYTNFKTEFIMDSIIFLPEVKKQYAFKVIIQDEKILKETKVIYKGIQVVRIDASKLGQRLLKNMIEEIILNTNIKKDDKLKYITKAVNDTYNEFLECINSLNVIDIGISCKWGKDNSIINSMKLYNFIMDENSFLAASAGRFVYCDFKDMKKFKDLNIDTTKLNAIAIPYTYNPEKVKEKLSEFGISLNEKLQWNRVFTTTCQRVVDLVKGFSK